MFLLIDQEPSTDIIAVLCLAMQDLLPQKCRGHSRMYEFVCAVVDDVVVVHISYPWRHEYQFAMDRLAADGRRVAGQMIDFDRAESDPFLYVKYVPFKLTVGQSDQSSTKLGIYKP